MYEMHAPITRPEYNLKPKIRVPFQSNYAYKDKIYKLRQLFDIAYGVCSSVAFGNRITCTDVSSDNAKLQKFGAVSIVFNQPSFTGVAESPTGFELLQNLFMHGDSIALKRSSLDACELAFIVDNIWADDSESDNSNVIPREQIKQYWESISDKSILDLDKFRNYKKYAKARSEAIAFSEYIGEMYDEIISHANNVIPDDLIDKTILPRVEGEINIVRDALLSLHYQHGVGIRVVSTYLTDEMVNRVGAVGEVLDISFAAVFDTPKKLELLRRCIINSESVCISPNGSTGNITLSFDVANHYRP